MIENPTVAVLGGGSFGSAIANLIAKKGNSTTQWLRDAKQAENIRLNHENMQYLRGIKVNPDIKLSTNLELVLSNCDLCFIALPSSALRNVLTSHHKMLTGKMLISLTKGIETHTFKLMSEVIREISPNARLGVMSGPNLAYEIAREVLTGTVIASRDKLLCMNVYNILHSDRFCVSITEDLLGVELGGTLKNVYAIIAGIIIGMGMGENARSLLITRALKEMSIFGASQGASPSTFSNLSGVGDLVLSCTSSKSRNYRLGLCIGKGLDLANALKKVEGSTEGVNTLQAFQAKIGRSDISLPLLSTLYKTLFARGRLDDLVKVLINGDSYIADIYP